ncbi:hypothetical protein GALMADRAFT_765704 [Galerina marginata CBS 339.88]|uniref:Uncharacterized protein n=1 Tax=Galerina marginata (strain CBS 339.88) TaxID=685588 RepID=A0A067SQ57_GALM3|nr:hypothetical protein GALMADRAFT_765704 [Galerina marginata CBS 339.88]
MSKLVNNYEAKLKLEESTESPWFRDTAGLIDFFEPNYLIAALTKKPQTLGALIFGTEEWSRLRATIPAEMLDLATMDPVSDDPLTVMFRERGLLSSTTHLPVYDTLFEQIDHRKYIPHKTYTYRSAKQIWSVVRAFPENSWVSDGYYPRHALERITGTTRQKMLFKHIVKNTNSVAVGPLEYCGNGVIVRSSHRVKLVSAVPKRREDIIAEAALARVGHTGADEEEEDINDPPPPDVMEEDSGAEDGDTDILLGSSNASFEDVSSSDESNLPLSLPPSEPPSGSSSDNNPVDSSDFFDEDLSANSSDTDFTRPPRKKKKTHLTADREMVLVGSSSGTNAGPDSENHRQRRNRTAVNYARPRRKYTKSSSNSRIEADNA